MELPYGRSVTKRLVVPEVEDKLYKKFTINSDTNFVVLVDYVGGDSMVERVATAGHGSRIFPENPNRRDLIQHLRAKSIFSPFKSCQLKFHIQSSIADALHIVYDHRVSVNEYSGRYSIMVDSAFIPTTEYLVNRMESQAMDKAQKARELMLSNREANYKRYQTLVDKDVDLARELARTPLEINNDTTYFWKINLYSLVSLIKEKRALLPKNHTLQKYLDILENVARCLAPEATEALFGEGKEIQLTYPKDEDVIDKTPMPSFWSPQETIRLIVPELEEILFVKQPYLEHGSIQVVDYMGDDRGPVESARISYGIGTKRLTEDTKLLKYLFRHRHTTPFEHVELAVEGKVPIFVDPRQADRHRTLASECFMGEVLAGSEFFVPSRDQLRQQDRKNRQGRGNELNEELKDSTLVSMRTSYESQTKLVNELRELGIPEDIIRGMKSVGFYTYRWRTGDLHNWAHFLSLRMDAHSQKEIRDYAKICAEFIKKQSPSTFEALKEYRMNAMFFIEQDLPLLSKLVKFGMKKEQLDDINFYKSLDFTFVNKKGETVVSREGKELKSKLEKLFDM